MVTLPFFPPSVIMFQIWISFGFHVVNMKIVGQMFLRFLCALHKLRFGSYMKRERELIFHWCCPGYVWFTASWTNCKQSTYRSFLYLSSHVKHIILIIDSCVQELFLIMRMSYMLFIFKVIAVYFKTICNSIFHKPTLSIPVSLPHSLFHSLFSLSFTNTFPSSSQSQNTLQHM